MQAIFDRKKDGEKLTTLEAHDIICHLADAVLSGGIRRAALIALFNLHDQDMLTCKFGNWWENNPQRGRANNSAVLLRSKLLKKHF
jgi:ribonucleoside-triphosphate reductase (thioredoxin)